MGADSLSKDVAGFTKLEKELSLFERTYDGFPYWQYIRFYVCEMCFSQSLAVQEDRLGDSGPGSLARECLKSIRIICKEARFLRGASQSDLLVIRNDNLKDRFFEGWQIPAEIRSVTYRRDSFVEAPDPSDHFFELPRLQDNLNKTWRKITKRYPRDAQEDIFLAQLEAELKARFGMAPGSRDMLKKIYDGMSKYKYYTKYYKKLLEKTGCKAILCIVYYNVKFFPLFKLAKERGIPIIELQHGVINNHEEYWFEDDRGVNNYTPDYMLTFGEIHNTWIRLVKGARAIAVGVPYQQQAIGKENGVTPDDRIVMVYPEADPRFETVIDALEKKLSGYGYRIMIKLHPKQAEKYEQYYPILSQNRNLAVITSQKEGIYHWLKMARHHVMASTTVGLEAMAFDHCNVCIAENVPHDQTQCLLDWGVARGFKTAEELAELILSPMEDSPKLQEIRNQLWKRDARNNMEAFFRDMAANNWAPDREN